MKAALPIHLNGDGEGNGDGGCWKYPSGPEQINDLNSKFNCKIVTFDSLS